MQPTPKHPGEAQGRKLPPSEKSAIVRAQPLMRQILGFTGVEKHRKTVAGEKTFAMRVSIGNVYRAHGETDAAEAALCRKERKKPHVWRPVV